MKKNKKRNNKNNYNSKLIDRIDKVMVQIKYATNPDTMKLVFSENYFKLDAIKILTEKFTELRKLALTTVSNDMEEFETIINQIIAIKTSLCDKNYFSFDFDTYREFLKDAVTPMCEIYHFNTFDFYKYFMSFRDDLSETDKKFFSLDIIKNLLIYHIIEDVIKYITSISEKRLNILMKLQSEIQK